MKHGQLMRSMIRAAVEKHDGKIAPAGDKKNLEDSFTEYNDKLLFWYNDPNNSTCVLTAKIDPEAN
jgi:hypothetical protein